MNNKTKTLLFFFIGAITGMLAMYLFSNYRIEKKNSPEASQASNINYSETDKPEVVGTSADISIELMTNERTVIDHVKTFHELPAYYITKSEARKHGWNPSSGNLCDVLPGKAIGGDRFTNREKQLPAGAQYYEADVNYNCGNRGADRIVFTKDGDVWLTKNHYKTFEKQ